MALERGDAVVDHEKNSAYAPDDDDFAEPPFVPTNQRKSRGRPKGSIRKSLLSDAPQEAATGADDRSRGRGRAGARLLHLGRNVASLPSHARAAVNPPAPRNHDDIDDIVHGSDDGDVSAESDGHEDDGDESDDDAADGPAQDSRRARSRGAVAAAAEGAWCLLLAIASQRTTLQLS